jgi:hypothetical protein
LTCGLESKWSPNVDAGRTAFRAHEKTARIPGSSLILEKPDISSQKPDTRVPDGCQHYHAPHNPRNVHSPTFLLTTEIPS